MLPATLCLLSDAWDILGPSSIRLQVANPIEHLGCNKLPIMETGTSKEQKVTMSALKGLVSVSFCVRNQHEQKLKATY